MGHVCILKEEEEEEEEEENPRMGGLWHKVPCWAAGGASI
jgi:hypothetical protein